MAKYKVISGGVCAAKGFSASGVHARFRANPNKLDLAIIKADVRCAAAGVYTTNKVCGAPIKVDRAHLKDGYAQAILVNSGNANTCAANGVALAEECCELVGKELGIDPIYSVKNYSNTLTFRFGGQYRACDWLTARMGMYVDESPVSSDYLNPETPSMTKLAYTAGVTFRPCKWMHVDLAYGYVNSADPERTGSYPYVNSVLAKMEAVQSGYDEALMLDVNGCVSEATGENVFIVRNNVLKTTPGVSILEGINRDAIMCLAEDLGYRVVEQVFTRDEMYTADVLARTCHGVL